MSQAVTGRAHRLRQIVFPYGSAMGVAKAAPICVLTEHQWNDPHAEISPDLRRNVLSSDTTRPSSKTAEQLCLLDRDGASMRER